MSSNFVFIGDSLTIGLATTQKGLTNRAAEKYPEIRCINLGVGGDTVSSVDTRKANADSYNPFRVVVWIGVNDVSAGTSAATIEASLQSIYTYYSGKGYEVWALTITPKDDDSSAKNTVRNAVNTWIKETATDVDLVIDAFDIIADPADQTQILDSYAAGDSVHINDEGYAALVAEFPS